MHYSKKSAYFIALLMIGTIFMTMSNVSALGTGTFEPSTTFSDNGYDKNASGYYEYLNITVRVNITNAGDFHLFFSLYSNGGITLISNKWVDIALAEGVWNVTCSFNGILISNGGFDGPYLTYITLRDQAYTQLDLASHDTAAYLHTEFELPPLSAPTSHTDRLVNTDADPKADFLEVNVTFNVLRENDFSIAANLRDNPGTHQIASSSTGWIHLAVGIQTLTFRYNGYQVNSSGYNGPYMLQINYNSREDTSANIRWPDFMTAAYLANQFEPPGMKVNSMVEQVIDSDADSLYDELELTFNISILSPGAYGFFYSINHGTKWLGNNNNELIGDYYETTGYRTLTKTLDIGLDMEGSGNSTFSVQVMPDMYANGKFSYLGNMNTFVTANSYNASDFGRRIEQARIVGTPNCTFVDHDSDGKYDWVDVTTNVTGGSRQYSTLLIGLVETTDMNWISRRTTSVLVEPGITKVVHSLLPSWPANVSGKDSPYEIEIELIELPDWINLNTEHVPVTGSYITSDFNGTMPIAAALIEDYSSDDNENMMADLLHVVVDVEVAESGDYTLEGKLWNSNTTLGSSYWVGHLKAGKPVPVAFEYGGLAIRGANFSSPYNFRLAFTDQSENTGEIDPIDLVNVYYPSNFEKLTDAILHGKVVDGDTDLSIANASVYVSSYSYGSNGTATNSTGDFSLGIGKSQLSLAISAPGYQMRTVLLDLDSTDHSDVFKLYKKPTEDCMVRGFIHLKDGSPERAQDTARISYPGIYYSKELAIGPNGYYEFPVKAGLVIIQTGIYESEFGAARVTVPIHSTIWLNFSADHSYSLSERWDFLLGTWNQGELQRTVDKESNDIMNNALQADFLVGDGNGYVDAAEARTFARFKSAWDGSRFLDTSRYLLVNGLFYDIDTTSYSQTIDGLIGYVDEIFSNKFIAHADMSSFANIPSAGNHTITISIEYDEPGQYPVEYSYRVQLAAGNTLLSYENVTNINVTGSSTLLIDPGNLFDPYQYYNTIDVIVSRSGTPDTGSMIGDVTLSDLTDNSNVLIQILRTSDLSQLTSTLTDQDGDFMFIGLSAGLVFLQASASGHYAAGTIVLIVAGQIANVHLALYPRTISNFTGSIIGRIIDESSNAVRNATIEATYIYNSTFAATLTTGADGKFNLSDMPPSALRINITADGFLPRTIYAYVNGKSVLDVGDILLSKPAGKITGSVKDDSGKPVAGLTINLLDSTGSLVATTVTDANGNFTLEHLLDGNYTIVILKGTKEVRRITGIIVANGNLTDVGALTVSSSLLTEPTDWTLFIVVAAIIIGVILGILWMIRRPGRPQKVAVLKPEQGEVVEDTEEKELPSRKNRSPEKPTTRTMKRK